VRRDDMAGGGTGDVAPLWMPPELFAAQQQRAAQDASRAHEAAMKQEQDWAFEQAMEAVRDRDCVDGAAASSTYCYCYCCWC
jgi:hypothetical protein